MHVSYHQHYQKQSRRTMVLDTCSEERHQTDIFLNSLARFIDLQFQIVSKEAARKRRRQRREIQIFLHNTRVSVSKFS